MITAFMEGRKAADEGKNVLSNPYRWTADADVTKATLWEAGLMNKLEQDVRDTANVG